MKQNPAVTSHPTAVEPPSLAEGEPVSRGEWIALAVLVAAGLFLRSSGRPIEHFDEGVYASNLFFDQATDFRFPNQHLYAPPLLPALIEWCMVLLGPSNFAAKLPAMVLGALTIPLVWWSAREWFGRRAGLLAAAFLAGSITHVGFSTAALTDVPVAFWMLAAVVAMARGIEGGNPGPVLLGGVLTGVAWWTKYSGWLPLAITGAAIVVYGVWPGAAFHGKRIRWLASRLALWLLAVMTAFAVWSPWLWSLQKKGGYAAVAANHRGYLVGWSGWLDSAGKQIGFLADREIAGILAIIAVAGIRLFAVLRSRTGNQSPLQIGGDAFDVERPIGPISARPWFGPIALGVWIIALAITIPLYRPYYRLTVPLLVPLCVVAGVLVSRSVERSRVSWKRVTWTVLGVMLFGLGLQNWREIRNDLRAMATVNNLPAGPLLRVDLACRLIGHEVCLHAHPGATANPSDVAIYVYGEPAILFHLRLLGFENAVPVSHLGFARPGVPPSGIPTFVVIGPQAEQSSAFPNQLAESRPRLTPVTTVRIQQGWIARFDSDSGDTSRLTVYRVD